MKLETWQKAGVLIAGLALLWGIGWAVFTFIIGQLRDKAPVSSETNSQSVSDIKTGDHSTVNVTQQIIKKSETENIIDPSNKQIARIHFEQRSPFVNQAVLGNDQTGQSWQVYFFQVQIFNESDDSNIRAKCLKLTNLRKLDGGVFKPWGNAVPAILKWPAGRSKEISPGENVFVPFARIFPPEIQKVQETNLSGSVEIPQLRFTVARWNRQMTSHIPPGTHRFKLTLFLDNKPPAEAEFQLEWSGEHRGNLDLMAKDIKIKQIE